MSGMLKALGFMGVAGLGGLVYLKYWEYSKINSDIDQLMASNELAAHLYETNQQSAFSIDSVMDTFERGYNQFSINKYRETLAGLCTGKVLETCAGSNRNLRFYKPGTDLTLLDYSPNMMSIGSSKSSPFVKYRYLVANTGTPWARQVRGGRRDGDAVPLRPLRLRAGHLRAGVHAEPAQGAGGDASGVPARRAGGADERGALQHRRVPLLRERQVGLQPHARRLLQQPQLGEADPAVRLRDRAPGAQEERPPLHLRPPQRQAQPRARQALTAGPGGAVIAPRCIALSRAVFALSGAAININVDPDEAAVRDGAGAVVPSAPAAAVVDWQVAFAAGGGAGPDSGDAPAAEPLVALPHAAARGLPQPPKREDHQQAHAHRQAQAQLLLQARGARHRLLPQPRPQTLPAADPAQQHRPRRADTLQALRVRVRQPEAHDRGLRAHQEDAGEEQAPLPSPARRDRPLPQPREDAAPQGCLRHA